MAEEEKIWRNRIIELIKEKKKILPEEFNKVFHNQIIPLQSIEMQLSHYYQPEKQADIVRIERILNSLGNKKGYICDLGCGVGTFVYHTAKKGNKTIGVDYSIESLNVAQRIGKSFVTSGKSGYVCADSVKLPFQSECFDAVIAADFLEHLTKRQKEHTFNEICRILKKRGIVIIGTPNGLLVKFSDFLMKLKTVKAKILGCDFPRPDITTASHIGLTNIFELKKLAGNKYTVKTKYFIDNIPFISRKLSRFPNIISFLANLLKKIPLIRNFFTTYIVMVMEKIWK